MRWLRGLCRSNHLSGRELEEWEERGEEERRGTETDGEEGKRGGEERKKEFTE